jgi:hypothetical protein
MSQGEIQQVTDTLSGFQTTRDWRLSANASTRFYGTFEFNPEPPRSSHSSRAQSDDGTQLYSGIAAHSDR